MAYSLSRHGKQFQAGAIGLARDDLPPFQDGPIDLKGWFGPQGHGQPLDLEIGAGKGTFLVQQAPLTPEVNYIGLEYARAFWLYAADRCRRRGLVNVRLVHAEAGFFLRHYVPDGCFRCVHVYFPDPWPKKRHHKRRLIQAPFLRLLHAKLSAEPGGGSVRLATDHSDYYQWMLEQVEQVGELYDRLPFESAPSAGEGELVGSNFERKYRREGRPFNAMILRRRPLD
jgi:tRNA (guanine-N7-)-methyltransferase